MWVFDPGSPLGTDPRLVENLVAQLHDRGFSQVAVGCTTDSASLWLENRDLFMLAAARDSASGLTQGGDYDILDLGENVVPVAFPESSVLKGTGLRVPGFTQTIESALPRTAPTKRTPMRYAWKACWESCLYEIRNITIATDFDRAMSAPRYIGKHPSILT